MKTIILWSGIGEERLEHCVLAETEDGFEVEATIIGEENRIPFKTSYQLQISKAWCILSAAIKVQKGAEARSFTLHQSAPGCWLLNGNAAPEFDGCSDIDITGTPFTNSLPVNRLGLSTGQTAEIDVVYFNLDEGNVYRTKQRYTKMSAGAYKFETIAQDFEAVITVDKAGLVMDYRGLFRRIV